MAAPHYFFAVPLENHVKEYLDAVCKESKSMFPFKRWVHREDFHVTLAFLGNVSPEMLQRAQEKLAQVTSTTAPFSLATDRVGIFGKQDSPRILWKGVKHSSPLCTLQQKVNDAMKAAEFYLDERPFRPHITMARKWIGDRPFSLVRLENHLQPIVKEETFVVKEVVLYETLPQQIPKYKVKNRFHLIGEDPVR